MPYITERGKRYLIRGPYKAPDLRKLYQSFVRKYGYTLTLAQWLVQRGKVYSHVTLPDGKGD